MSRTTFDPRQQALIEKAAKKGPWRVLPGGGLLNKTHQCVLQAAVDCFATSAAILRSGLSRGSALAIINASYYPWDPRRPELLRLLGVEEAS